MKELLIRSVTGISLVVVFVGSILLGPTAMFLMLLLVYGLGTRELFSLLAISMNFSSALLLASGGLLILGIYGGLTFGLNPLWLLLPATFWISGYLSLKDKNPGTLLLLWMAIPLASFIASGWIPGGTWNSILPIAIIAMVWINDTMAYVAGNIFGKHPMTPRLSPGKTWEGFAGGLIFSALSGWAFYHFTGLMSPATWILAGTIASLLGLAGDLFESSLKRNHDVKDMGSLLPGHGGILDRFDSLLFVAPALFLLFLLNNLLT